MSDDYTWEYELAPEIMYRDPLQRVYELIFNIFCSNCVSNNPDILQISQQLVVVICPKLGLVLSFFPVLQQNVFYEIWNSGLRTFCKLGIGSQGIDIEYNTAQCVSWQKYNKYLWYILLQLELQFLKGTMIFLDTLYSEMYNIILAH